MRKLWLITPGSERVKNGTEICMATMHASKDLVSVTTQMKALDEYFLVEVFTLLLNRFHVFANFKLNLNRD